MPHRLVVLLATLLLAMIVVGWQQPQTPVPQARLKAKDELTLILVGQKEYSGDYTVQDDGALYLPLIGRTVVSNLTVTEAQSRIEARYRRFLKEPTVSLLLKKARDSVVYVVGGKNPAGAVPLVPGVDLRMVLAQAQLPEDPDLVRINVFRGGKPVAAVEPEKLFEESSSEWNGPLEPDDVVVIQPLAYFRVWVLGNVTNPGQVRVQQGSDVYQAISLAGGLQREVLGRTTRSEDFDVSVRRGPNAIQLPGLPTAASNPYPVQAGDTIFVEFNQLRVTVSGEVLAPGVVLVPKGSPINVAIAAAGGPRPSGTLNPVYILRNGELMVADASTPRENDLSTGPMIQANDAVFVIRNQKVFTVLGEVRAPGRIRMEDGRSYRLSDAIAEVQGIYANATFRRIHLARAGADGKFTVRSINLDEFLKDGKLESNPEILPGDYILVGKPSGVTAANIGTILGAAFTIDRIFRP
jgi:protein involved in polysaccharide export with SLBB domain